MANGKPNGDGNGRFVATGKTVLLPVGVAAALLVGLWQFDRQQDQRELERAKWEEGVSQRIERLGRLEEDIEAIEQALRVLEDHAEVKALEQRLLALRDRIDSEEKFTRTTLVGRIERIGRDVAALEERTKGVKR